MRRKRLTTSVQKVESKEEQRNLLRRSKDTGRCSSLGFFNPNDPLISDEMALDYLANIIVRIYLAQQRNEQKGSDLLPGLNKRTSR